MNKEREIFFVTYPDGSVAENSPAISEDIALANFLSHWLPIEVFGAVKWGQRWGGGAAYHIWPAMEKKGFKIQSIPIPENQP